MAAYKEISTDVLIIGGGAAGLSVGIELTKKNVPCLVLSKRAHGDAHTKWAAGGINASFGNLDEEDNWAIHAADTLKEGQFVCNPQAVEMITKKAPERVKELQEWGCDFDLTDEGEINQRYFGAQSFRRTCFVGDHTGKAILDTLVQKAAELEVPIREKIYITSLVVNNGQAVGAIGFDMVSGEKLSFKAKVVLMASGGFASIYNRSSSRADENTADNVGLGYEAGAILQDMEFVQFHPTGMVKPDDMTGRLVSEAVRGEGGHLLNKDKERFMEKYSPDKMELDARDVVARAISQEIKEGRGTENGGVWLDISHRDSGYIKERLPKLVSRFEQYGIDFTKEPVEVAPTSHYAMGGLKIDFETGETNVKGLYAAGEATAGVHGGNRLGGNSLCEAVVFGQLFGKHLSKIVDSIDDPAVSKDVLEKKIKDVDERIISLMAHDPKRKINQIRDLLWEHAGIVRDKEGLYEGLEKLEKIKEEISSTDKNSLSDNPKDWEIACNLYFILIAAEAVLKGALMRNESRGAHYRKDSDEMKKEWLKNILYRKTEKGMELTTKKVGEISKAVQEALEEEHEMDYHHLE